MKIKKPVEERLRGEDDVSSILLDPSMTLQDFGMIPKYPLNKGIKKAVEWYKVNGVSQTYTHLKGFDEKEK